MMRLSTFYPKCRFLFCMSAIYLFAFTSLYIQLPGLFGEKGITPVNLAKLNVPKDFNDFIQNPTLLRFSPYFGLDAYYMMEFLVVIGCLFSFMAFCFEYFRSMTTFAILWICYLSVFKVGQAFLWFQWDILLLEAGALTILLAGADFILIRLPSHTASDGISLWLIRWLLFRLMFSSGVVKLTSKCPTWWGLSALNWHYQSQCIPTPIAWYVHAMPSQLHQLSVAVALAIEIFLPFLFFVPLRGVRMFSFYSQVLLQICIILTGNYNFFNMLTIALCYSLLTDDEFLPKNHRSRFSRSLLTSLVSFVVIGFSLYACSRLFGIQFALDGSIMAKIAFSESQFNEMLRMAVLYGSYMALGLFAIEVLTSLLTAVQAPGCLRKLHELVGVLCVGGIGLSLLLASLVPLTNLAPVGVERLPQPVLVVHAHTRPLHLVNSYGLFRRMTGVGPTGRPELVLEASSDGNSWQEIHFHHKPGRLERMPSVVVPHQPRLDWQMWFAALSSSDQNPWFANLVYRLLTNEKSVVDLLESTSFSKPKFIRARLYNYYFTKSTADKNWWTRNLAKEYLPATSLTDDRFMRQISDAGLVGKRQQRPVDDTPLIIGLQRLRTLVGQPRDLLPLIVVVTIVFLTSLAFGGASRQTALTCLEAGGGSRVKCRTR